MSEKPAAPIENDPILIPDEHPNADNATSRPMSTHVATRRKPRPALFIIPALLVAALLWKSRSAPPAKTTDAAAADAAPADAPAPIEVGVVSAALRPMETVVRAQGTLTAGQGASARVAVTAAGRLASVLVREGDRVSAGQLLAVVDNRSAAAGQRSAAASLSASEADVRQAELATRATQSDQANALRQAQLALQSAASQRNGAIKQAAIALRSAQSDLRKTQVGARAPDVSNALQQAQLALKAARLDRDASTKAARNALQAAQTDLTKLQAGARPQEIAQAEQAVAQAQATRDRAATEEERVQFLFDKGIKARRELDDAKTALRVAESSLKSAQDALNLLQAGTRPEDITAGELRVAGARDALDAARQSGDAKVLQAQSALQLARGNVGQATQQRPEDVRAAVLKVAAARDALRQAQQSGEAQVLQARAALRAARQGGLQIAAKAEDARAKQALAQGKAADLSAAQIAATSGELRAPISGIVTRRNLNPGDMADTTSPILEITDSNALTLMANVSAAGGARVLAGMAARVSTETLPGRVFSSQVISVGQIDPQTNLLAVRIAVPNPGGALKVGAFADAQIVVQTRPLTVVVPQAAVLARDGKSVVLTAGTDGKAHQKTVVTGIERNGLVEIVSGLKAGERVIRTGGYQLDDGAPITTAAKKTGAGA